MGFPVSNNLPLEFIKKSYCSNLVSDNCLGAQIKPEWSLKTSRKRPRKCPMNAVQKKSIRQGQSIKRTLKKKLNSSRKLKQKYQIRTKSVQKYQRGGAWHLRGTLKEDMKVIKDQEGIQKHLVWMPKGPREGML